jgi:hypothetical protein
MLYYNARALYFLSFFYFSFLITSGGGVVMFSGIAFVLDADGVEVGSC